MNYALSWTDASVEQRSFHSLDICEDKWLKKRDAQIDIQNMIFHHVTYLFHFFVVLWFILLIHHLKSQFCS